MNRERNTIHTKQVRAAGVSALVAMTLAFAPTVLAGVSPEQKCEAGKNGAAGKYTSCIANAQKVFVTGGDAMKYADALAKCDDKYGSSWGKLEGNAIKAGSACPSTGDEAAIRDFVDACTQAVAEAVGGGTLPLDVGTCNTDLTACEGDLAACESNSGLPVTGQTTSYGPASDGAEQRGAARDFTDNGDGTITDNVTGLMWEKKSDDESIHDYDNTYSWSTGTNDMDGTIVTTFLATLNGSGGFAGYTDWRIPNRSELISLLNLENMTPAAFSEFNNACAPGCTVTTCSCTIPSTHWSSTTLRSFSGGNAWTVVFNDGDTNNSNKTNNLYVRAVRGGS